MSATSAPSQRSSRFESRARNETVTPNRTESSSGVYERSSVMMLMNAVARHGAVKPKPSVFTEKSDPCDRQPTRRSYQVCSQSPITTQFLRRSARFLAPKSLTSFNNSINLIRCNSASILSGGYET